MKNPLVSILIPVYNRESLVGETIESAINQTYRNIEIIIVDNCSIDKTWQVLEYYAAIDNRIRLFKNKENVGPVRNWKRCIDEAKGEYAKILFSDDLISENFVEETLKCFDKKTAFVLSPIKIIGKEIKKNVGDYYKRGYFSSQFYLKDKLFINNYIFPDSPGCALFRATDMQNNLELTIKNPYKLKFEEYGAGNDLLLFLNTALEYKKIGIAKNTVSYFRNHADSFTISKNLKLYYDFIRFHFLSNYAGNQLPKLKASLMLRRLLNKTDSPVEKLVHAKPNWYFMLSIIINKLIYKFS